MNEQTQTHDATITSQTVQDFKHAVLIVSVLLNLTIFVSWVLAHAAAGTL